MAFNYWLVRDRVERLEITNAEWARALGGDPDLYEPGADPEKVSVAALFRIAHLLGVHPADLIDDSPGSWGAARADALLLEFAVAARRLEFADCGALLDWSDARLRHAVEGFYSWLGGPQMGVARGLSMIPIYDGEPVPIPPAEYRRRFAAHTAPDPFEAAAVLRVIHCINNAGTGPAHTNAVEAQRLAARHLVVLGEADPGRAPFADTGLDTPITPHPDLLFALDIAGPPPAEGQVPAAYPDPQ